ncbi:MAG TPA: tRNA 2-thiouridine(34) synthase MnmA [Candidatus Paceibacterota bacterium]|nr:tRNA 2-thiouridine(34) synthase MnmA [Candidatus Paceibacterota bacterium]
MNVKGKRVYAGLSGGVDSAVTAALLVKAGAEVTGVFIKGWYPPGMPCTWAADRRDAMRVAARLGIPFITLDASDEYKRGVIDYLLREYQAGRTPNPDVMCNREVKFGAFYTYAKESGADYIATGHYARSESGVLLRGIDEDKDQSYFLWAVPQDAIAHTLLPVGGLKKDEVRNLARRFKLPVADKRDSQGICFLGNISVEDFLRSEFGSTEGIAIDEEGKKVGMHKGATLHTLGERIALAGAAPGPWYVVRKDMQENVLVVAKQLDKEHVSRTIRLSETNWHTQMVDGVYEAQYRYHGPIVRGYLNAKENTFTPEEGTEPLAPGQSLVLYTKDRCHGGGIML